MDEFRSRICNAGNKTMAEVEIGVLVVLAVLDYWQFRRTTLTIGTVKLAPRRSSTGINNTPLEDFTLPRPRVSLDQQETTKPPKPRPARNTFPIGFSPIRRGSISGEPMAEEDLYWTPPHIPKSEEEKTLLLRILRKNVLMQHLSMESLEAVVQAVQRVHVPSGQVIISEGDFGDGCYIVEEGKLSCSMKNRGHLCYYNPVLCT